MISVLLCHLWSRRSKVKVQKILSSASSNEGTKGIIGKRFSDSGAFRRRMIPKNVT